MGDVINLRDARTRLERSQKSEKAAVNRAKHGRTKAERRQEERQRLLEDRRLEGHQRDRDDGAPQNGDGWDDDGPAAG